MSRIPIKIELVLSPEALDSGCVLANEAEVVRPPVPVKDGRNQRPVAFPPLSLDVDEHEAIKVARCLDIDKGSPGSARQASSIRPAGSMLPISGEKSLRLLAIGRGFTILGQTIEPERGSAQIGGIPVQDGFGTFESRLLRSKTPLLRNTHPAHHERNFTQFVVESWTGHRMSTGHATQKSSYWIRRIASRRKAEKNRSRRF